MILITDYASKYSVYGHMIGDVTGCYSVSETMMRRVHRDDSVKFYRSGISIRENDLWVNNFSELNFYRYVRSIGGPPLKIGRSYIAEIRF